ncbi:MAG TPA: PQQ-dependent dehydrogenase, methanol/ethanol family, partial [Bryobacteraceae bacterium]|nr:PQQ-dependent dehydrogenase, methanol/ethanol family [Bryobacteraceae bacterium]
HSMMPVAAKALSPGEIQDLLAYLARLTRTPGGPVVVAKSPARGITYQDLLHPNPANWLSYNGSYNSQRYSQLKQIDLQNVATMVPKWIFHMPGAERLESVPVVVDGVMYVSQPNEVYALDGRSGRVIWEYRHQPAMRRGPNRGVAVYSNKVYFGTPDARLVALDALTGNLLWQVQMADPKDGYWCPVAPLPVKGKIIMGIAPGDHGLNGWLDAYDAQTGERAWRWNAIPRPGEPGNETWSGESWKTGGGNTWLTGSYDPELNLIYWGIGNPAPDFNGDYRKGDNLYTESMVALDADSGKLKWHFQFTPHDVYDWDAVEIPILVDAPYQGQTRKLLVQANRNGFYYVLDRTTGEFLHGTPFVKLLNWASGLTKTGRPIQVPGVEPSLQGTKICPATAGATNWMSPAYHPETNWFYVVAMEGCGINTKSADKFQPGGHPYMATGYIESPEEPWQMHVRALNLTTGKIEWDYPQTGSRAYGAGLLATAGGLIFAGDDQGELTALDARSGKVLWHFNTGQRISASPVTYSYQGKQYIALGAGSNVVAFGLP